jgi:hypothetical protein
VDPPDRAIRCAGARKQVETAIGYEPSYRQHRRERSSRRASSESISTAIAACRLPLAWITC